MDDPRQDPGASEAPLQGPHRRPPRPPQPAPEPLLVPLRLLLQPGGMVLQLTRPDTIVGRHSTADVRLPLPDVSRRHCRFVCADGLWRVVDLNSLNGIFVNGEKVQEAVLRHRDTVRIGGFTFVVELDGEGDTIHLTDLERRASDSVLRSIADALPHPDREPPNHNRRAS